MKIFISHYHGEKHLAIAVKTILVDLFADLVSIFIADDIPVGSNWLNRVGEELRDTDLVIVLFSPNSVHRPWINIEAGYGVMTGKTVIPVCHSGLDKKNLPVIYSLLQAVDLCAPLDVERLLIQLAKQTKAGRFLGDLPRSVSEWIAKMNATLLSLPPTRRTSDTKPCVWIVGSNRGLPDKQAVKNLRFIALFAQVLIQRKFRVVFGRSGLLDNLANSLGHELDSYDMQFLSEFGNTSALHKNSPEVAPNPVIVVGSIRADKGPKKVFNDTLGVIPDVLVLVGGSPSGRSVDEVYLARTSGIPIIPLTFSGGQAGVEKAFVDKSLVDEVTSIQESERDFASVAQKLCDIIERQTEISRATDSTPKP